MSTIIYHKSENQSRTLPRLEMILDKKDIVLKAESKDQFEIEVIGSVIMKIYEELRQYLGYEFEDTPGY